MSFWKNYKVDPSVVASGDQFDQLGEGFLDDLVSDVSELYDQYGDWPLPCLLAAELVKNAEDYELVEMAVPLALGAAMIRLAKIKSGDAGEPDISGLEFECE